MSLEEVRDAALQAKKNGSERFCMGAAWRNPTDKSLDRVIDMIKVVKSLDMESCVTLGMLTSEQANRLKEAGLDYYNHNLDTSKEHYSNVITTRCFQDRIDTLENVHKAGINVCSGGILGLGERVEDRASMLQTLANMEHHPDSVPINLLVPIPGTPLEFADKPSEIDFIRCIAVARIVMPKSVVRLSAGRTDMSESMQATCFFAGANSIFYGDELLTTPNVAQNKDQELFASLGIN
jgi:biotin synthase